MTKKINSRETLESLYGDLKKIEEFYMKTPGATISKLYSDEMQKQVEVNRKICNFCINIEPFLDCKQSVKRTIGECNGYPEIDSTRELMKEMKQDLNKLKELTKKLGEIK